MTSPTTSSPAPRLVRAADAVDLRPFYPVARLIKGAVVEAEAERAKARSLLEQAIAEAERIQTQAMEQAKVELAAAREEGHRQGLEQYAGLIAQSRAQVDSLTQSFAGEVTRAAFRIAREIIDAELATKPQTIVQIVTSAIDHLRSRFPQRILVHLHPDDFDLCREHQARFADLLSSDVQFDLVKDGDLSRHQVVLETEMGHYDFSIECQLQEIRKAIG